jgi:hypothetical protein
MSPAAGLGIVLAFLAAAWTFYGLRKTGPAFFTVLLAVAASGAALYSLSGRVYEANALHRYESVDYLDASGWLLGSLPARKEGPAQAPRRG